LSIKSIVSKPSCREFACIILAEMFMQRPDYRRPMPP
jgi:hypothetical protein